MTQKTCPCSCTIESCECPNCSRIEELNEFEWAFETPANATEVPVYLTKNGREVKFNPAFSMGTAGLRGDKPLMPGRHYLWEIKMLNNVYGTDVMVGIGTNAMNLNAHHREFRSLLGSNGESWGFSYRGRIVHNGVWEEYGCPFGKGSIIGVHLDLWRGVLEFCVDKKYLGVAFHFPPQVLYPMVSSTAANSVMRLISCSSWASSLQFYCLRALKSTPHLLEQLITIPGLKAEWGTARCWLLHQGENKDEKPSDALQAGNDSCNKCRLTIDLSSSSEESSPKLECLRKRTRRIHKRRSISK